MAATIISTLLVAAGDYDLVDLDDVKGDLNLVAATDDDYLQRRITDLSLAARAYCNRTFQVETVRDQFWPQRDLFPWQVRGGLMPLQLSRWPLVGTPAASPLAAPGAPALSAIAGGALAAATYFAVVTYMTIAGETLPSLEASLAVGADDVLVVASPPPATDLSGNPAIGWNVYVGAASGAEQLQNAAPIPIGTAWTEPAEGLAAGAAPPPLAKVSENGIALVEGTDYAVDAALGQLTRLHLSRPYPKRWNCLPIVVEYSAGYAAIPEDLSSAISRAVAARWFGRLRDPMLKSQSASGVYAASYLPAAAGGVGDFPPDVVATLDRYRVPVVA